MDEFDILNSDKGTDTKDTTHHKIRELEQEKIILEELNEFLTVNTKEFERSKKRVRRKNLLIVHMVLNMLYQNKKSEFIYVNHCSSVWLFLSLAFFNLLSEVSTLSSEKLLSDDR